VVTHSTQLPHYTTTTNDFATSYNNNSRDNNITTIIQIIIPTQLFKGYNTVKPVLANTPVKLVSYLEFNIPFQHKYGYIKDERSEGQRAISTQ